jgi:DNA polymerase-1
MIIKNKEGAALSISVMDDLKIKLDEEIRQNNQEYLYYEVELYLTEVLADMEIQGVYVDKQKLNEIGLSLVQNISEIENEIYNKSRTGRNKNIRLRTTLH